jgi:hypothetical protein
MEELRGLVQSSEDAMLLVRNTLGKSHAASSACDVTTYDEMTALKKMRAIREAPFAP